MPRIRRPSRYTPVPDVISGAKSVWEGMSPLEQGALATAPIPVVGDVMGILADTDMYMNRPEERNWPNYLMSAAGVLPFVPSRAQAEAGLDMAQAARMERAREMGFDTDQVYYHGSRSGDIDRFDLEKTGGTNPSARGIAAFVTDSPQTAGTYTGGYGESGTIYPVYVRKGSQASFDFEGNRWNDYPLTGEDTNMLAHDAMDEGYNTAVFSNIVDQGDDIPHELIRAKADELYGTNLSNMDISSEEYWEASKHLTIDDWKNAATEARRDLSGAATNLAVFDPRDIRSIYAEFDPAKSDSANLLASMAGGAVGLGALGRLMEDEEEIY